jgi:DNA modification methylase
MENVLCYGDNLDILRRHIPDEFVDLIYLDPPFNSRADYNVLFKEPTGKASEAQITAFEDTWHWTEEAERAFHEIVTTAPPNVIEMMEAFRHFVGLNDVMAYLTMMSIRLLELRRVLKPSGSIYLHCDPTASHYLKVLMDTIFGKQNFRNEIIWKRTSAHSDSTRWGRVHDVLLFYTKSDKYVWNPIYLPHAEEYKARFRNTDEDGRRWSDYDLTAKGLSGGGYTYEYKGVKSLWRVPRSTMERLDADGRLHFTRKGGIRLKRYLDEMEGLAIQDVVTDISPINSQAAERLGYPTQKPEALLERIIRVSSDEGATVLDPFCGCGTTITAAHRAGRRWIGIDLTHLAINLIKLRLKQMFGLDPRRDYTVIGEPEDLTGAQELASHNRYQFQWWALSLIDASPVGDKKKGKDRGIDGLIYFTEDKHKVGKGIVSVKSGKVSVKDIRDLGHVMDREKAQIGIFITLQPPTKDMVTEAVAKGFYRSDVLGRDFPRIQIMTIENLLQGARPEIPWQLPVAKKAVRADTAEKLKLDF